MLIWIELHPYLRGLVLTGLFVMMCISLCLVPNVFRRGGVLKKISLILCASISFGCVTMFGAGMKGAYYGVSQSAASLWVEKISGAVPVLILLAVGIFLAVLLIEEIRYRKRPLPVLQSGRASIICPQACASATKSVSFCWQTIGCMIFASRSSAEIFKTHGCFGKF